MSEGDQLNQLADDLVKLAKHLAPGYGLDPVATAMACGFAGTKLLAQISHDPDERMEFARIYSEAGLKSMADIVAGANTPNQRVQ